MDPKILIMMFIPAKVNMADYKPRWGKCRGFTSWLSDYSKELPDENTISVAGPRSAVGNVSGYRCVSDCGSRGREFDPGPVPYFRGD